MPFNLSSESRGRSARRALAGALAAVLVFGLCPADARPSLALTEPPSRIFGPLFERVQRERVFADDKTFADAIPLRAPSAVLADFALRQPKTRAELAAFVAANFELPEPMAPLLPEASHASLRSHIAGLWPQLTRQPATPPEHGSQLALSRPYVVPGGRFREVYYWDSYFTMLGLIADGRRDLAASMTDDFAELIDRYGHVPNGSRTYYLSRSQPPVFYLMAGLTEADPVAGYVRYLSALRREHGFWMRGEAGVRPGEAVEHVVKLEDGAILNRYWDASDIPRDEAFRVDTRLAAGSGRPDRELYHELRSGAESGWDFSSRWFADGKSLATIETTAVAPIDLNSLLYGLETAISQACGRIKDRSCVAEFEGRAARRKAVVDRYLWDARNGRYLDFQWRRKTQLNRPSAAMLYPLFVGMADRAQGRGVAAVVERDLLAPGGLRTTLIDTGQQWDAPNGWAPLQWIAVRGLDAYGATALADQVASRWVANVCRSYLETGKLLEKYDVETVRPGGGGEYPLQDGFGWTNGVTRAFLDRPFERALKAPRDCAPVQGFNVSEPPRDRPAPAGRP